jgi:hypothetical protein
VALPALTEALPATYGRHDRRATGGVATGVATRLATGVATRLATGVAATFRGALAGRIVAHRNAVCRIVP